MRGRQHRRRFAGRPILAAATVMLWLGSASQAHSATNERPRSFALKVTCERTYLAGFPMLVEVQVRNTDPRLIAGIPFFDLFTVPGPVRFALSGGGRQWTWEPRMQRSESGPDGVDFGPGQVWLALQDLAELHPDISPGHYQLSASMSFPGELVEAAAVPVEILAASAGDQAIAAKLRAHVDGDKRGWLAFVRQKGGEPALAGLSSAARSRLAFHLFLHRVAHGPQAVGQIAPRTPRQFGKGILESQAALSRLEILHAAGRPEAARVEKAVRERWPGLAWWIEQIRKGRGPLSTLRAGSGVASEHAPASRPRPHTRYE